MDFFAFFFAGFFPYFLRACFSHARRFFFAFFFLHTFSAFASSWARVGFLVAGLDALLFRTPFPGVFPGPANVDVAPEEKLGGVDAGALHFAFASGGGGENGGRHAPFRRFRRFARRRCRSPSRRLAPAPRACQEEDIEPFELASRKADSRESVPEEMSVAHPGAAVHVPTPSGSNS